MLVLECKTQLSQKLRIWMRNKTALLNRQGQTRVQSCWLDRREQGQSQKRMNSRWLLITQMWILFAWFSIQHPDCLIPLPHNQYQRESQQKNPLSKSWGQNNCDQWNFPPMPAVTTLKVLLSENPPSTRSGIQPVQLNLRIAKTRTQSDLRHQMIPHPSLEMSHRLQQRRTYFVLVNYQACRQNKKKTLIMSHLRSN